MRAQSAVERARDITEVSVESLRCIIYRHHSFPLPVWIDSYTQDGTTAMRADVRCDCGVRKVMYAHPITGARWRELDWYDHPDGTLVAGGRPSQDEGNLEAKRRQTATQERAARKQMMRWEAEEQRRAG